jgi:hypothetical protein
MNSGINLAGTRVDPKQVEIQRKVKRLRIASLAVLSVVCLVSVVLFVMIVASPLPGLRQKEEELFLALNSQNSKIQRIVFVDKQLGHVEKVIETRSGLPETLGKVMSSAPSSLLVETFAATNNQLEIVIESQSLSDIQEFIDGLTLLAGNKEIYQNISISELSLVPATGTYQVRVTMNK